LISDLIAENPTEDEQDRDLLRQDLSRRLHAVKIVAAYCLAIESPSKAPKNWRSCLYRRAVGFKVIAVVDCPLAVY
jgi:hypothetical protein